MKGECLLATLDSTRSDERIQVILSKEAGDSRISLVQQSWAESVGWYTQQTVELTPDQIHQLRGVLGGAASPSPEPRERIPFDPGRPRSLPFVARRVQTA